MKMIKQERGAVTLFVLVAMLFFTLFLVGIFMLSSASEQTGAQETAKVKEIYEKEVNRVGDVYKTIEERLNLPIENPEEPDVEPEEPLPNVFASFSKDTLYFFNDEQRAKEMAQSEEYYYGNVAKVITSSPWFKDKDKINYVNITEEIHPINVNYYFAELQVLRDIKNIGNLKTDQTKSMAGMFRNCKSLQRLDVSQFDTRNVSSMAHMFYGIPFAGLNLSNFDTSRVKTMGYMFSESQITKLDLTSFNTSNVTTMEGMFQGCSKLTSVDLSSFDTRKVTTMKGMFNWANSITELDLTNFNTSNVTNMAAMFYACHRLTSLDLSSFNTSKVITMDEMFARSIGLRKIYVGPNWKLAQDTQNMFNQCGVSETTLK